MWVCRYSEGRVSALAMVGDRKRVGRPRGLVPTEGWTRWRKSDFGRRNTGSFSGCEMEYE